MASSDERAPQFWAYAGSFGALWGAVEATLGTFLHAMKLPFAGVLLASMGAALLVALRTLVPRPGILLATGAVCAAVKLSSPGTVLIGPAVGILTESLLVELAMLLGTHPVSALLAGALAASWAICQKVLTQVLLYGAPIVSLYEELLSRGSKMLGLSQAGGMRLVIGFVAAMATFGALAALAGLRAGRGVQARSGAPLEPGPPRAARSAALATVRSAQARVPRGAALAVAALAALELGVLVIRPWPWHAPALVVLLVLGAITCRPLLSRIGKPRGWAPSFVLLLLLGAWLGPKDASFVSREGALLAVTMLARALGLVLLCQAVLAALPPIAESSSAFARAVAAALDALPRLTRTLGAALRARRAHGMRPWQLAHGVLEDAVSLAAASARAE